jgi:hypothetical protein
MAKYEFDKKKFEEWKAAQKESAAIQEKMNSSLSGYFETIKKIGELQKNIQFIEAKRNQMAEEYGASAKEVRDNWVKLIEARKKGDADEIKALQKKDDELRKILASKKQAVKITEQELGLLKKQTAELTESAKQASLMSAGLGSAVGFLAKTPGLISKGFGMLKATGIFEMDKAMRNANKSMAGSKKTFDNLSSTIRGAANTTTLWGVGVKDLSIMQQGYSEEVGKSVMLTDEGFKSMAGIAEGTGLGKEFAVQLAGGMDKFNISAERSGEIVEKTMNQAAKMGVNGAAALKSLQSNLKLAQKFNFKGGIAGLAKLSVEATRLRLDMEGIAGMADRVFRPEGAIEMAAELTTMGGRFAALGDPMQLMFKARNDMAGFTKDIGKASGQFVEFNKVSGEMEIKPGGLDMMRRISEITGIAVEKLQEMGEADARLAEVKKGLKGGMFQEDDMELIGSLAKFEDGKWKVETGNFSKDLKDLKQGDIALIKAEEKTLEERAKFGRSFDETIQDLILMVKEMLLPLATSLKENFGNRIQELGEWFNSSKFREQVDNVITGVGDFIKYVGDFMKNNPITSAIIAGGTLFGGIIAKAAMWVASGVSLGLGFMSTVKAMGGVGGMGPGMTPGMAPGGGKFGVPGGQIGPALPQPKMSMANRMMGNNVAGGKFAAGSMGSMGLGMGLGVASMGMNYGRSQMDDQESTGGKLLGIGAQTAEYAAMGAMFGPYGALIGGGLGLGKGIYDEYIAKGDRDTSSMGSSNAVDLSQFQSGGKKKQVNDGIMFHPQDKFMKVNDSMTLASTQKGQLEKAATKMTGGGSSNKVTHDFEELKITLKVDAPTDQKFWKILFDSPELMRRLTEEMYISKESALEGGKITGSGPKRK